MVTAALPAAGADTDYESFYAEGRDVPVPEFVLGRLDETVSSLERYRGLNRWLDVGCGAGTLLRAAGNLGWEAVGTEVSTAAVESGRVARLDVRLGETADLALPQGACDVISMVEVLEHVRDPHDLLVEEAARLVCPGGAVYLTTPHGRSLSARLLRTRWRVVAPLSTCSCSRSRACARRCSARD